MNSRWRNEPEKQQTIGLDDQVTPPVAPPIPSKAALPNRESLASRHIESRRGLRSFHRALSWIVIRQPSWLTSILVHLLLLLILGLLIVPPVQRPSSLTLDFGESELTGDILDTTVLEPDDPLGDDAEDTLLEPAETLEMEAIVVPEVELPTFPVTNDGTIEVAGAADSAVNVAATGTPDGFDGRGGRRGMAVNLGATAASEEAVDRALRWLAAHQQADGRWSFDLRDCGCDGACENAGRGHRAINGATAIALLPFLGAGQTHERGYHRSTVEAGLRYLLNHQGRNGSFHEDQGTMYSHGLATLVLCEAAAMTRSDPGGKAARYRRQPELRQAAQEAINYTIRHQHPSGGWRYVPGQRGDTSVVGWQAMALQSGKMIGLKVPKRNLSLTSRFLDSVMADSYGGRYGYMSDTPRPVTSAVGVLTRMYLGWDRTHPGVIAGAEYIDELGPSVNNVYFNYYATQVMHHYEGPLWKKWHPLLRDHLVDTQMRKEHETGSWYFDGDFGSIIGGRLYVTALSAMILEVYYRHMPIYSESAVARSQSLGNED